MDLFLHIIDAERYSVSNNFVDKRLFL